jgi:hypothetical protein
VITCYFANQKYPHVTYISRFVNDPFEIQLEARPAKTGIMGVVVVTVFSGLVFNHLGFLNF